MRLHLEQTSRRGVQYIISPHQERFIQNINDAGGLAFVTRSVDDVIEKLDLKKESNYD